MVGAGSLERAKRPSERRFDRGGGNSSPILLALAFAGLTASWFGFHWDIAAHIDVGRDAFLTPAHLLVLVGAGTSLLASLGRLVRLGGGAGPAMVASGSALVFAALAFDNWWHQLFGVDVTVASPAHLMLMAGFLLEAFGLLRCAVDARAAHWLRSALTSAVFLIPSLMLLEYQLGFPPYSPVIEPVMWCTLSGVALGAARRATEGWSWSGTVAATAILAGQVVASAGNAALGRSAPLPPLAIVAAGVVCDLAARRRRALVAAPWFAIAAASLVGGLAVTRWALESRALWSGEMIIAAALPSVLGFALAFRLGGNIVGAALGPGPPLRTAVGPALLTFVAVCISGTPLLLRAGAQDLAAEIDTGPRHVTIRVPGGGGLDSVSLFTFRSTQVWRETRVRWLAAAPGADGVFRASIPPPQGDIQVWYASGFRHWFGTARDDVAPRFQLRPQLPEAPLPPTVAQVVASYLTLCTLTIYFVLMLVRPDAVLAWRRKRSASS